ncbi:hypothetical protein D3C76_1690740 [compost metagenome]
MIDILGSGRERGDKAHDVWPPAIMVEPEPGLQQGFDDCRIQLAKQDVGLGAGHDFNASQTRQPTCQALGGCVGLACVT